MEMLYINVVLLGTIAVLLAWAFSLLQKIQPLKDKIVTLEGRLAASESQRGEETRRGRELVQRFFPHEGIAMLYLSEDLASFNLWDALYKHYQGRYPDLPTAYDKAKKHMEYLKK